MTSSFDASIWLRDVVGCRTASKALEAQLAALPLDDENRVLVGLLATVASWRLDGSDRTNPLASTWPGRTPGPEDVSDVDLDVLRRVVEALPVADLRARIWDLVWLRTRRDHEAARNATAAYREAARALAHDIACENRGWDAVEPRLRRALAIAHLRKDPEDLDRAWATVREIVASPVAEAMARLRACELLVGGTVEDASLAAATADNLARQYIDTLGDGGFNWEWLRSAFSISADACKKAGDASGARGARQARAATYEQQADWLALKHGASRRLVANLLQQGMQARQDLGETAADVSALHARLLETQKSAMAEFQEVRVPRVTGEAPETIFAAIAGQPFADALCMLAEQWIPPRQFLVDEASKQRAQSPFLAMVSRTIIERADGRTLHHVPTTTLDAEVSDGEVIELANTARLKLTVDVLNPIRELIAAEHPALLADWLRLLDGRPLAEPSRRRAIAAGLSYGLRGEFIASVALLVPQIEHMLRLVVKCKGGITTTSDANGVQLEVALSSIFARQELRAVLGEDLVLDLRALLDGLPGANLRNRFAHGLMEDVEFGTTDAVYLWFSVLRLLLLFEVTPREPVRTESDGPKPPEIETGDGP